MNRQQHEVTGNSQSRVNERGRDVRNTMTHFDTLTVR